MRGLLLILGQAIARAGEELQALALKGAGVVGVKPAKRAEAVVARTPSTYKPLTVQELDHVRALARVEEWSCIGVCRGPEKGCRHWPRAPKADCSDCYVVPWHEKRSSAELLQAMERGDA